MKEAEGKAPARRTGTAYEAAMVDEKAIIFKVRYLYGKHGRSPTGSKEQQKKTTVPVPERESIKVRQMS